MRNFWSDDEDALILSEWEKVEVKHRNLSSFSRHMATLLTRRTSSSIKARMQSLRKEGLLTW